MDRIRIVGGTPLNGIDPDLRRQERGAAADDRQPAHRRDADARQRAAARRRRAADPHPRQPRRRPHGRRQAARPDHRDRPDHPALAPATSSTPPRPTSSSRSMRASFWVIAPLLARMGEAKVSLPGGCAIGTRPVDLLIMALERLGAEIEIDGGYVVARAPNGLRGAEIEFPESDGRRHAHGADGGRARPRHDGDRQRGARARGRRPRRLPDQDGRPHHAAPAPRASRSTASRGCTAPATRCCPTASRPAPTRWRWP